MRRRPHTDTRDLKAGVVAVIILMATSLSSGCTDPPSVTATAPADTDPPSVTATAPADTAPQPESPTTTGAASYVDHLGYVLDAARAFKEESALLVRGFVDSTDITKLQVVNAVAGWGSAESDGASINLSITDESDRTALERLAESGDVPILAVVDGRELLAAAALSDDLMRFVRADELPLFEGFPFGPVMAFAIDGAHLTVTGPPQWDPYRSIWCQEPERAELAYVEVAGDEVASLFAWADEALALIDSPGAQTATELRGYAEEITVGFSWFDDATGRYSGGWVTDTLDQLMRGVPIDEVDPLRTASFVLDPGDLSWLTDETAGIIFADTESGRLLGWTDFAGYVGAEKAPTDIIEIGVPTEGDLGIYLRALDTPFFECTEDLGDPYLVIPRNSLTGLEHRTIDLAAAEARAWEDPED